MADRLLLLLGLILLMSLRIYSDQPINMSAVEGQAFALVCDIEDVRENLTFTWTKENRTLNPSDRIFLQGSSLWFLKTLASDSGLYTCRSSNATESQVFLAVEVGPCPRAQLDFAFPESNFNLSCTEEDVPTLGHILQVVWWKECKETGIQGSPMQIFNVSMNNEGNYTCMVTFRHNNKEYITSRTIQLQILPDEPVVGPKIICPKNKTLYVKPDVELKLECHVFIGLGNDSVLESSVYWTINNSFTEAYPQIQQNNTLYTNKTGEEIWHGNSTLFIPKVLPEFFGVPFECIVLNPSGSDISVIMLIQDDNLILKVIICSFLILLVVVILAVLIIFFKRDFILVCRHSFGKANVHPGKLYNACVFYPDGNNRCSSVAKDLALKHMPELLEQKHELKLFIHGRDDPDAKGNPANMTDVLSQSQAVVFIVPGSSHTNRKESLIPMSQGNDGLNQTQLEDLFAAITESPIPLILVETETNADYSLLPKSVNTISTKKEVLRWSDTVQPQYRFWKRLRYHMT